jgi:hypothetical protein
MSTFEIPDLEGVAGQLNRRRLQVTIPGEACKMASEVPHPSSGAASAAGHLRDRAVRLER